MMSMADIEVKLRKCSHTHSQDLMGQLIHPSTDFKMSEWSSAFAIVHSNWLSNRKRFNGVPCGVI